MEALKIAGIAFLGLSGVLLLRTAGKGEYAVTIEIACGVVLSVVAFSALSPYTEAVRTLLPEDGISALALRMTGITLIIETASRLCRDANLSGLSQKTELCGKALLLSLCLPALQSFFATVSALLS